MSCRSSIPRSSRRRWEQWIFSYKCEPVRMKGSKNTAMQKCGFLKEWYSVYRIYRGRTLSERKKVTLSRVSEFAVTYVSKIYTYVTSYWYAFRCASYNTRSSFVYYATIYRVKSTILQSIYLQPNLFLYRPQSDSRSYRPWWEQHPQCELHRRLHSVLEPRDLCAARIVQAPANAGGSIYPVRQSVKYTTASVRVAMVQQGDMWHDVQQPYSPEAVAATSSFYMSPSSRDQVPCQSLG